MEVEEGPPILKAARNHRSYKLIKLRNGLQAVLIHDPHVRDDDGEEEDGGETAGDAPPQEPEARLPSDRWPNFQYNFSGLGADDFTSDWNPRLQFHPDEEGGSNGASLLSRMKQAKESALGYIVNNLAAAAMCVGVGALSDPPETPGLAHYLEHMLFMGTTKFPDENEYNKFLSLHGGSSNANTDQELTCYYFKVRNRGFRGALERFSQFFVSPLVKAEAMDREVQVIESEFVIATGNDLGRLEQIQCHTARSSHPFHRFTWGNKKCLQSEPAEKGIDMRAKLLEFYDHYLAGRMKLAVLGGASLETLQKWVVELFGEIKEGGHGRLPIPCDDRRIWEPNRLYRLAGGMENNVVDITWPLPCLESAYLSKPQDYCGYVIGHEGEGSLLYLLVRKGWARGLWAGCGGSGFDNNSLAFLFQVSVTLTNLGADHLMEVIGLLYQYLKMLRSVGPQAWVFHEQKAISTLNFEYSEDPFQDEHALSLAKNMHLYPEAHVMYGDYAYDIWNPDLVSSVLSQLTPDNMRVDLLSHRFDRTAPGVQMEPWFEMPFTVEPIPPDLLALWADPPGVHPRLHIPAANVFIPRDFTILTSTAEDDVDIFRPPLCLVDSADLKVWHKPDTRFRVPRTNSCFSIMFCPSANPIADAVLAQLWLDCLLSAMSETKYLAGLAKLDTSVSLSGYRIELQMFGFSEKLPVLAENIARRMKAVTLSEVHFAGVVEFQLEDLTRANQKPVEHATYLSIQAISKRFWNTDLRRDCLQSLTFQDFENFVANLFRRAYIECFFEGNILMEQALSIAQIFKDTLVTSPLPLRARPTNTVVKIPRGTTLLYRENCKCEYEKISVVRSNFQFGQDMGKETTRLMCLVDLFENVISESYFDQLRTQEQLGYDVMCSRSDLHGVVGFFFMVQSARYSPAYLESRINAFIMQIPALLMSMTQEEFQSHKESLIATKLAAPNSLRAETDRYWRQIWDRKYSFDASKHEAAKLLLVSKNELIDWSRLYFSPRSRLRRYLCVHVVGLNAREGDVDDPLAPVARTVNLIENLDKFKDELDVYPAKV